MAVQHRVLKELKKKAGLRQRDWEVLCACQRLSLAKYPFTASKVDAYLSGAYFLPSLYGSIQMLLAKGYIRIVVPGKAFRPESYEMTYSDKTLIQKSLESMRSLYEKQDLYLAGKIYERLW